MKALTLAAGLLLPWAAGAACLYPLQKRLRLDLAGLLGYGYFLGAALLYLILLVAHNSPGEAAVLPVVIALLCITIVSLWLGRLNRSTSRGPHPSAPVNIPSGRAHWLAWTVLGLVAVHFVFIAIEQIYRPVFPWDALQTWMYKAKAWYHAGGLAPMDSPADWLSGASGNMYNAQGAHYPGLVPAQSYWVAQTYDAWSEPQVNWPTFLCGVALCLALWSQVANSTGSRLYADCTAYLLVSIPIVHTHLSLAGYADIWLAGFSGLGLVALLRGMLEGNTSQAALGTSFLFMGLLAKFDALIWLACGLGLYGVICHGRAVAIMLAAGGITLAGLAASGINSLTLPLLGSIGVAGDNLLLGPLGTWPITINNVASAYIKHLYLMGSWNLLWYLAPLVIAAALFNPRIGNLRSLLAGFFLMLITAQVIVFGFTVAGTWAEDGTSLNRILLQATPAVVFLLVLALHRIPLTTTTRPSLKTSALPIVALLIILGSTGWWLQQQATGGHNETRDFSPQSLRAVMGASTLEDGQAAITRYQNGSAILSTGSISLDADKFRLARIDAQYPPLNPPTFFWRLASDPQILRTRPLAPDEGLVDLGSDADWRGRITEIGLAFSQSPGHESHLKELSFLTETPTNLTHLAMRQWLEHERWTQASANAIRGGAKSPQIPLHLLLGSWLVLCALLLALVSRRWRVSLVLIVTVILTAWGLSDLRWLQSLYGQSRDTIEHYTKTAALDIGEDAALQDLSSSVAEILGPDPGRIMIGMHPEASLRFEARRVKYLLLPHAAYVHDGDWRSLPSSQADAVLLLRYPDDPEAKALPWTLQTGSEAFKSVWRSPHGVLYAPTGG